MGNNLFRPKNHVLMRYREEHLEKSKFLFPIKIGLFGDEKVGKTSICNSFIDYNFTDDCLPTIGTNKVETKAWLNDREEVKLIVWDTSGQERFREIVLNTVRNFEGIALVFDITNRKSFDNIEGWISLMKINFDNPIMILFGNKADLDKQEWKVTEEEINLLCGKYNLKYFGISAKNRIGIIEGFSYLEYKIYDNRINPQKEN